MDCFVAVYRRGRELNIDFGTNDLISTEDADVLIYMAQPNSPKDVVSQKRKCPGQKAIMLMSETSVGGRFVSNPRNHSGYDAIFTYVTPLVDGKRYFFLSPRAYYRHRITTGLPFEQRRIACLVGTNRVGPNRRLRLRTGLFAMKKGWKFSVKDWFDYVLCPGQLDSFRAQVGKACAIYESCGFDIFGEGWDLLPETRGVCLGIPAESTLSYVGKYRYYFAFENHTSDYSLISERVWDALWGDSVPVYLGHTSLDQFIPRECYIDARQFDRPAQMLEWLRRTPESTWARYRKAGREFIQSNAVQRFLPESFAEDFVREVANIAARG
jgi:hypothetical protein